MSGVSQDSAASWLQRIAVLEQVLCALAFLILVAVLFADVLSREFFGAGIHWARQAGVYANFTVVMLGFGLASARGLHLRPRFADGWLPVAWNAAVNRLADLLTALFCLGFAVIASGVVYDSYLLGERSAVLGNVIWPVQALMPGVFLIAAGRYSLYALFPALRPATQPDGPE